MCLIYSFNIYWTTVSLNVPWHCQVIPQGLACQSGLRVGDRILEVNTIDLRHATHQEAVRALLANKQEIRMLVRRDPSPPGMQVSQKRQRAKENLAFPEELLNKINVLLQEISIQKQPGEKLGISIRGGAKGHAGNPFDPTDEGIFISKVLKLILMYIWGHLIIIKCCCT